MLIVNFKNYKFGIEILNVAKIIQRFNKNAIVCVPAPYIGYISNNTKLKVFSQHINDKESGTTTGFLVAEAVKGAGASGTLLNHSEHKLPLSVVKKIMERCKKLNLRVVVCASTLWEVKKLKKFNPYAIAYEDPKLISTGKSITSHNPKAVLKFVKLLKNSKIIPLCGAGVSSMKDYDESLKLGCKGALVASAIAKSKNPAGFFKG